MTTPKTRLTDSTKGALEALLEPFDDEIPIVDKNGKELFAYYRIDGDGNGQIVMVTYDDA